MSVITCIRCPRGCQVSVDLGDDGSPQSITGNACLRGAEYARLEIVDPRRTVTTTVRVKDRPHTTVSVKTSGDVPKDVVLDVIRELAKVDVEPPVRIGQVVVANVCNTGIDVVATSPLGVTEG